jgi:hypothetical protein
MLALTCKQKRNRFCLHNESIGIAKYLLVIFNIYFEKTKTSLNEKHRANNTDKSRFKYTDRITVFYC